jgi:hypothetical protein
MQGEETGSSEFRLALNSCLLTSLIVGSLTASSTATLCDYNSLLRVLAAPKSGVVTVVSELRLSFCCMCCEVCILACIHEGFHD